MQGRPEEEIAPAMVRAPRSADPEHEPGHKGDHDHLHAEPEAEAEPSSSSRTQYVEHILAFSLLLVSLTVL